MIKKQLTEFECLREAGKTYSSFLTLPKAIEFLKFEHNWEVEIVEEDFGPISKTVCDRHGVTQKQMHFMKNLQESGEVNMMASSNIIQARLMVDRDEAKVILMAYLKHYNEFYFPENIIVQ